MFSRNKQATTLITGASGLVGTALVRYLDTINYQGIVLTPTSQELNLLDVNQIFKYFDKYNPNYVFMIAAKVGGIKANINNPVEFLADNLQMELNLFNACYKYNVRKSLYLGSSCIYPRDCLQPMKEEYLMTGPLEPTNEGYAMAKLSGLKLAEYYKKQYEMLTVCPIPCNIYGPNDSFDFERSHVLSALVRRFVDAQDNGISKVTLWGTGKARREFINVKDVAESLVFFMDNVVEPNPINLGTGEDISIFDLAVLIANLTGYQGEINWNSDMPDGMPRKCLDVSQLSTLGFVAKVDLVDGVKEVIKEYRTLKEKRKSKIKNIESIHKIEGIIDLFLEHSSRINEAKPQKYWYPLSMATYGTEEILQAIDSLCSFRTTMWEKTKEFEAQFCAYQNCQHSIMVNSGSSADLLMSFLLSNPRQPLLETGDEILIPVVTWPTQIWSAMMSGLKVRLVDVNPRTLNVDLDDLQAKISSRTRAIFLVHLMGNPCEMDQIIEIATKNDLIILEDCCEALGSSFDNCKVGNFGLSGAFSFFFSHHISTMEGGMISTNDQRIADDLRMMRAHGWARNIDEGRYNLEEYDVDPRYAFLNWGFNVRPTEIQAGFGICQLEKLPVFQQNRQKFAQKFFDAVDNWPFLNRPVVSAKATPSWFALPILIDISAPFNKNSLINYLEDNGIETRPIVAGNLARQPVAKIFHEFNESSFLGADQIHEQGFYIGLSPMTSEESIDRLLDIFQRFIDAFI